MHVAHILDLPTCYFLTLYDLDLIHSFLLYKNHREQTKRHGLWFSTKSCSCYSAKTHENSMVLIFKIEFAFDEKHIHLKWYSLSTTHILMFIFSFLLFSCQLECICIYNISQGIVHVLIIIDNVHIYNCMNFL